MSFGVTLTRAYFNSYETCTNLLTSVISRWYTSHVCHRHCQSTFYVCLTPLRLVVGSPPSGITLALNKAIPISSLKYKFLHVFRYDDSNVLHFSFYKYYWLWHNKISILTQHTLFLLLVDLTGLPFNKTQLELYMDKGTMDLARVEFVQPLSYIC